jgi:menaquinone-dependent protoporphyrinogen oxidase
MAKEMLIIYSSVDGHTLKICNRLKTRFEERGMKVDLYSISAPPEDPGTYDSIIVASSIRYGKHNPKVVEFIKTNSDKLQDAKAAFVSVNLVARKPEKASPETNPYVRKFLESIDWKPELTGVFAGKLDYQRYGFWDRIMIQLIMLLTKGPTDPTTEIEYTDWEKVDDFAFRFLE